MQTHYAETAIRAGSKVRTKEQRAALLIKANILDSNGDYVKGFFSSETIKKDKARREEK
ncbi:hypothetical protein RP726_13000 [Candidatus Methylospira mobilis]|uniref:hypothetical protein n=1 Tax=Candidatus Methylospira mobilis TaxID=1808979 RepID=UPI0012930A4E|nr:hypothetical protein [Candidatus Methylospira mobilis]WNV03374.1 hypothetical protein RP726_13000 [Candidatus Methylospira mobilis]